jgi:V8-like Glu-specific endopeptidase
MGRGSMKLSLIALVAILSVGTISNSIAGENVIYGKDGRKDVYEVTNPLYLKLSSSTTALIKKADLAQNSSGVVKIKASSFADTIGVCKSEKYSDQPSGAFCSGSLIGKHLMLTAGHCITSQDDCNSTKFVFGYDVLKKGKYPSEVAETQVVGCKSIVYRVQNGTGADFGLIELDRDVTDHEPLKLAMGRVNSTIDKDTKLLMIGHPAGIPTKIEDSGKVRDPSPNGFFVANTDSYGGNSGSAVFNQVSGEIEGVLVRGEQDYVHQNGCYVSNVCAEDGCRGEDVTKVAEVIAKLPTSFQ